MRWGNFVGMLASVLAAAIVGAASAPTALAVVDASWTGQAGNGSWIDGGNWNLSLYPQAAGDAARLVQPSPSTLSIHLDAPITLGRLVLSRYGGAGYVLDAGAGGSLALDNSGAGALLEVEGTHFITAPTTLGDALTIQNCWHAGSGAGELWLQGTISGGSGITIRTAADGPARVATAGAPGTSVYLTAENTFQGSVTVRAGAGNSLTLIGPGTALYTPTFLVDHAAGLNLDNSLQNVPDRVASPVLLNGGALRLYGTPGDDSAEELPYVSVMAGVSTIECTRGAGGLAMLTLSQLDTSYGTTVRFSGADLGAASRVYVNPLWGGLPLDDGLIGGWATVGSDFATYDALAGVLPLATYALVDINSATAADNLAVAGPSWLTGDRNLNSLKLAGGGSVDLAGHTLNIESGGLILGPPDPSGPPGALAGGRLTAGRAEPYAELLVHLAAPAYALGADLVDNPGGSISLIVSGDGSPARPGGPTLVLSGNNTYTGPTYVNACTVAVDSDARLGDPAGPVVLTGGTLRATAGFASGRMVFVQGMAAIETPGTELWLYSSVFGDVETLYVRGSGSLTLAGEGLVSGAIDVGVSQLLGLRDGGTLRNVSGVTLHPRAALELDNGSLGIADRLAAPVTSRGGRLELIGSPAAALTQKIPAIIARPGASVIACTAAGRPTILEIDSLQRSAGSTVDFRTADALSRIALPASPLAGGILGGWATAGNDWATLDVPQTANVRPLTPSEYYAGDLNLATPAQNVQAVQPVPLTQAVGVNSLKLAMPSPLDLGGNLLSIESGGLLIGAETGGFGMILGGVLTTGVFGGTADELIVHLRASAFLGATIMDGPRPLSLTVSGNPFAGYPDALLLMPGNLYTGPTTVSAATLAIYDDSSLGPGTALLTLVDGTLEPLGSCAVQRPIRVDGLATLAVQGGDALTLNGPVLGEGDTLQVTGGGTVALTNANVFLAQILVGEQDTWTTTAAGRVQGAGRPGLTQPPWQTTLRVTSDANLGDPSNGVTLDDGRLLVSGTFQADAARTFTVGSSGGTFDVEENKIFTLAAPGQLVTSGGQVTKAGLGGMILGGPVSASAPTTLAVAGGQLVLTGDVNGAGPGEPPLITVSVSGGAAAVFNASQHLAGLDLAGLMSIGMDGSTSTTTALRLAESGGLATGKLDITNGSLVVDYTGKANPFADVQRWVNQAYNGGAWDSNGITSGTAALDPVLYGIAVADNASPNMLLPYGDGTLYPKFGNVTPVSVSLESVLVKLTYRGDVNLDGVVDDLDVAMIGLFYDGGAGPGGKAWFEGDIYLQDGYCDDNDVAMLGLTYGYGWLMGDLLGSGPAGSVPEPATLALLALGAVRLALRRRAGAAHPRG
jgi:autotransporter-associated beta strand protein